MFEIKTLPFHFRFVDDADAMNHIEKFIFGKRVQRFGEFIFTIVTVAKEAMSTNNRRAFSLSSYIQSSVTFASSKAKISR